MPELIRLRLPGNLGSLLYLITASVPYFFRSAVVNPTLKTPYIMRGLYGKQNNMLWFGWF